MQGLGPEGASVGSSKEGGGQDLGSGGGGQRGGGGRSLEGGGGEGAGSWSGGGVGHGAFFVFLGAFALFLNCKKEKNTGFLWGRGETLMLHIQVHLLSHVSLAYIYACCSRF